MSTGTAAATPTSTTIVSSVPHVYTITEPRVGGKVQRGNQEVAWTGGSNLNSARRTKAVSLSAFRPTDSKAGIEHEKRLRAGFSETKLQLGTMDEVKQKDYKGASLRKWMKSLRQQFELDGRDTVFRLSESSYTVEINMLTEWGQVTDDMVSNWEAFLENHGDDYDADNLSTTGDFIYKSISDLFQERFDHLEEYSGPRLLLMIIKHHQASLSLAIRKLVGELSEMKLSKEPKQDVIAFSTKVSMICQRITSLANATTMPHDLHEIVARLYKDSSVFDFRIFAGQLAESAENGATGYDSWKNIIDKANARYDQLRNSDSWDPDSEHKEDEIKSLKAQLTALKGEIKKGTKPSSPGSQAGTETRTCHHCKEKGHIRPNCPKLKAERSNGTASSSPSSGSGSDSTTTTKDPKKTPPADHDREKDYKQTFDDVEHKWCHQCRRWTKGDYSHFTREHKKGFKKNGGSSTTESTPTSAGAGLAGLTTVDEDFGSVLNVRGGFMASSSTYRPKDFRFCKECETFVRLNEPCCGTLRHQHGRCVQQLSASQDFY